MATQTRKNSLRARTRLKSAMSGASFRVLGTTFGPPRDSKTLLRTAQNQLGATSGPLRDHFGAASGPPDRKTPLKTTQNQLGPTSGPLRDHFGAVSGPPDRKTALSRTAQNQQGNSSRPLLGLQAAKHRGEPVQTSSRPAPSPIFANTAPRRTRALPAARERPSPRATDSPPHQSAPDSKTQLPATQERPLFENTATRSTRAPLL